MGPGPSPNSGAAGTVQEPKRLSFSVLNFRQFYDPMMGDNGSTYIYIYNNIFIIKDIHNYTYDIHDITMTQNLGKYIYIHIYVNIYILGTTCIYSKYSVTIAIISDVCQVAWEPL